MAECGLRADRAPRLIARRNTVVENTLNTTSSDAYQLGVQAGGGGVLILSDGVVARGNRHGLSAWSIGGLVHVTNLTVTAHPEQGVVGSRLFGAGEVLLSNTIAYANGSDVLGSLTSSGNLVGVDPIFVDTVGGNYRLVLGSPGVDAGTDSPPGGLGPLDLDGDARIQGPRVDVGAYETSGSGGSGGSSTACRALWADPLIDRYTNACICAMDRTLTAMRCGFMGPEMFAVLRIGLRPPFPGGPVPAEWTLHPWVPVAGPYSLQMEALVDQKWQSQVWFGPGAEGLVAGRLVREKFRVEPARSGTTPLRLRIRYQGLEQKAPRTGLLELLLPELLPRQKR